MGFNALNSKLFGDSPNGLAAWPTAAAPAAGKSFAAVVNKIYDLVALGGTAVGVAALQAAVDVIDGYHDVPTADAVTDATMRDVVGRKTDAAVTAKTTTKSLMAYIKGVLDVLGDIATFPAAAVPANAVSHGAVLRYLAERQGFRYASKDVTFGNMGATNLFTVTSLVELIVVLECLTDLTSGTDSTIEVGISTSTAVIIPQLVSGVTLDAGELLTAASPAPLAAVLLPATKLVNGATIIQTIGGANATGGTGRYHCLYRPWTATGAVVAA